MTRIAGFSDAVLDGPDGTIAYSIGGDGPPLMLLHGFPQTRAMWAAVAPALARDHTVICPDLRGYGASHKPDTVEGMSFRAMGADALALMTQLGFETFALAGHDRGGRTAHRMALDAAGRITRLCLMDIVPTHTLLTELSKDVAKSYYHWFFLAQPSPFPETLILTDPDAYFQSCLLGWGGSTLAQFNAEQLAAYRAAWRDPDTVRAMCHDYRAGISVDFDDDAADLGARTTCPTLVLWGADGMMARAYDVAATWDAKCTDMTAMALPGGHFFVDTHPDETTQTLRAFFG